MKLLQKGKFYIYLFSQIVKKKIEGRRSRLVDFKNISK